MQDLETGICQEIEIRYKHLHLEKDYWAGEHYHWEQLSWAPAVVATSLHFFKPIH
jgi:hypothetical protein